MKKHTDRSPKVSVIIPVYNVEKYLEQCLDSVIHQSLRDIEIVCVNDCTPDNSQQILDKYASKDQRLKICRHKLNRGLPAARNTGIDASEGQYLYFLDSDDFLNGDDAIESLFDTAIEDDADEVIGGVLKWKEETDQKYQGWHENYLGKEVHGEVLSNLPQLFANVVAWNKLIRKSFLSKNQIRFNEAIIKHEDIPFSCKVHILSRRISILPKVTYIYRQVSSGSIMSSISEKDAWCRCMYCYDVFHFIESKSQYHRYRKIYYHRYARQLLEGASILSTFNPSIEDIETFIIKLRSIISLLPDDLPGIPKNLKRIFCIILSDTVMDAWRTALEFSGVKLTACNAESMESLLNELNRHKETQKLLTALIERVYCSRSWRITSPLRYLSIKVRGK